MTSLLDKLALEVAVEQGHAAGMILMGKEIETFTARLITKLEESGWQLMPKWATPEMYSAWHGGGGVWAGCYDALLAAAPRITDKEEA